MDIKKIFKEFGKYILGAAAAALLFLSGVVPFSWQDAISMLIDPTATIAQAVENLNDVPKKDIVDAVAEEKPELVKDTVTDIKPNEPAQ